MKRAFAILSALFLISGMNAHAWKGGPWSYDTFQPNGDDGIYEAVATTQNGMGMYRWAVRNNGVGVAGTAPDANVTTPQSSNVLFGGGLLGSASSNVWYYRGITYYGPAFGIVNSSMGIVSVIGNASTDGLLNAGNNSINNVFLGGVVSATTAGNIAFANSSFTAKFDKKYPIKRFSGSGVVSFVGAPDTVTHNFDSTVNHPGGATTVTDATSTEGGRSSFPQQGHVRSFKVIGAQVSTVVAP